MSRTTAKEPPRLTIAMPTDEHGNATFEDFPQSGFTVALVVGREVRKLRSGEARALAEKLNTLADQVEEVNGKLS